VTITALHFRPATNTSGKTPAVVALHGCVVALHGCGCIYGTAPAWRDRLTPRHLAMADLLVAEGFAVLFPDSFNARGRREICSLKVGCQGITQDHRRLDVLAALSFLRTRAEVDGKRVALLGWSHGGSATLASINRLHPVVAQFLSAQAPADRFYRTAVALYPGCIESIGTPFSYAPATEVSIFIGESDDRTSSRPCVALGERMAAVKQQASSPTYRDTDHGFDTPNMVRPLHRDVSNGVNPGQGVTIAPNAAPATTLTCA
jgi:dienelactone hydrolase